MAGIFEQANQIVVESGVNAADWTNVQTAAGDSADPTLASDGVAIATSRIVMAAALDTATTYDLVLWLYVERTAKWYAVDSSVLAALTQNRLELANVGKAFNRAYIQVLNSDGNVTVDLGVVTT
jgi:hypothetical protein